jgi:hypothetical protein
MRDEFLRLYLFNNTIFKIRLCTNDLNVKVESAKNLLYSTMDHFKGTIKNEYVPLYDFGRKLTNLNTIFKYVNFKDKFNHALG